MVNYEEIRRHDACQGHIEYLYLENHSIFMLYIAVRKILHEVTQEKKEFKALWRRPTVKLKSSEL